MRTAALRSMLVAFCLPIVAFCQDAQEPLDADVAQGVQKAPVSVGEALSVRQKVVDEAEAKLAAAQAQYDAAVAGANEQMIEGLKLLAKAAVAAGDLPEAAKLWEEVLKVDVRDADAVSFFETIKRGDVVRKWQMKPSSVAKRIEFRTASGRVYKREPDGTWSDSRPQYGRLHREVECHEYLTILERDSDKSLVLLLPDRFFWSRDRSAWRFDEMGQWVK